MDTAALNRSTVRFGLVKKDLSLLRVNNISYALTRYATDLSARDFARGCKACTSIPQNLRQSSFLIRSAIEPRRPGRLCATSVRVNDALICTLYERRATSSMYSAAQLAVLSNNSRVLRRLLRKLHSRQGQWLIYDGVLAIGLEKGALDMVRVVLDEDARAQELESNAHLYTASYKGNEGAVRDLLEHSPGCDLDGQTGACGGALHAASYRGHDRTVQLLLDAGADIDAVHKGPREFGSPLFASAVGGSLSVAQALVKSGASLSSPGRVYGGALQAAAFCGHNCIVQLLIDNGALLSNSGKDASQALRDAALAGYEDIVQLLLDNQVSASASGGEHGSALQAASCKGHENVARLLLMGGADPHIGSFSDGALQSAAYRGHEGIVQLLLDYGADVNRHDWSRTPLHMAAKGGHERIVRLLLNRGANVNNSNRDGWPLREASFRGHDQVVRLLLDSGAALDALSFGMSGIASSALEFASEAGHLSTVRILLEAGADIHAHYGTYETAIKAAAAKGHAPVVKLLIEWGAHIDPHDYGSSLHWSGAYYGGPLQVASYNGHCDIVQLLIESGADVNALEGRALQSALSQGHEKAANILRDHGATIKEAREDSNAQLLTPQPHP